MNVPLSAHRLTTLQWQLRAKST